MPSPTTPHMHTSGPVRILLIDASPEEVSILRSMLTAKGPWKIEVAEVCGDLATAADVLKRGQIHLVMADLDTVGPMTFEKFRETLEIGESVPVVLLYDEGDAERAFEALKEGVQDTIMKQEVSTGLLRHVIRYAIDRATIEGHLSRERDYLRALLDYLPDQIYFKDAASRFLRISKSMSKCCGRTESELLGKSDYDIYPGEDAEPRFRDEQNVIATGEPLIGQIERYDLEGEKTQWFHTTKLPFRDRHGNIVGTFGLSRDITRIKALEDLLSAERNLLRSVINNIPDAIFVKDSRGCYVLGNEAHCKALGVESEEQILGKTVWDFFEAEEADRRDELDMRALATGKSVINQEEEFPHPDGTTRWYLVTKAPLISENHSFLVCVNRDITAEKEAQNKLVDANANLTKVVDDLKRMHEQMNGLQLQLIEAEKTKSIARLAAGVAHEVKNPLAIISMGLDFFGTQFADDPVNGGVLKELVDALRRADDVIKGLLDFSAPKQISMEPNDLNDVIRKALVLVRGEMKPNMHTVVQHLADIPPVRLDPDKISQIFVNIFTNALHAMPEGGELEITTRTEQVTSVGSNIGGIKSEAFQAGDHVAIVEVADTGTGFPPENLARIFDPFFTTKPTGKGTGLGMTVVKSIVDLHGGTITIKNRPTCGAQVTLTLKI